MALPARRTKEEYLLLAVAVASAAVAVSTAIRETPEQPVIWVATSVALGLALATGAFVWFAGAARAVIGANALDESRGLREVFSALPDGVLVVDDGRIASVNAQLAALLGFDRSELVGAATPFPFWPPEHRHAIEAWHARLEQRGADAGELVLRARDGRRLSALVAGQAVEAATGERRYVLTVRDVTESVRRERRLAEMSSRDVETALLNERGLEARLGDVVRQARAEGAEATVVVSRLGSDEPGWSDDLGSPHALLVIERMQALVRAGDELARTRDDEVVWILPGTGMNGAIDAVSRARAAISDLGASLTAGVCDLSAAHDAPSVYALADRALSTALAQGRGTTATHAASAPTRGAAREI